MFFPEKIKSIKPNDRVLEVGPGGRPHPRSDVLLEKIFEDEKESEGQRGFAQALTTDKQIVYYQGGEFPFEDKEFDYVICSQVIEHVEDVDKFVSEINRVGRAGYIEYPLVYYDFLYNFPEHITFIKKKGDCILWMPKRDTTLTEFKTVNAFFYESLKSGYTYLVDELKVFLFEGFEWFDDLESRRAVRIDDLVLNDFKIPKKKKPRLSCFDLIKRRVKSWVTKI